MLLLQKACIRLLEFQFWSQSHCIVFFFKSEKRGHWQNKMASWFVCSLKIEKRQLSDLHGSQDKISTNHELLTESQPPSQPSGLCAKVTLTRATLSNSDVTKCGVGIFFSRLEGHRERPFQIIGFREEVLYICLLEARLPGLALHSTFQRSKFYFRMCDSKFDISRGSSLSCHLKESECRFDWDCLSSCFDRHSRRQRTVDAFTPMIYCTLLTRHLVWHQLHLL